ncbi:MAG TPA: aspartyl protease family protein [Sedimentisphaerales bacterium]|nr:aspartyl protease family protein [Sedimentisphaerales bacterium]
MSKNNGFLCPKTAIILLLLTVVCRTAVAGRPGWKRQDVDWRMTGGSRIKAINYPPDKPPPVLGKQAGRRTGVLRKKTITAEASSQLTPLAQESTTPIYANVIDSPPIDGFVPWIAVSLTDARSSDDDFIAYDTPYLIGNYLTTYPQIDFAIGLYDTGAAANIMGFANADRAGVFDKNLDGPSIVELIGATGTVEAIVSYPLGLFIDGLSVIKPYPYDPNGIIESDDLLTMVGEWNTSILLGQVPQQGAPDLPTAIGSPLSVYYAAHFQVDQPITVTHNSRDYTGPHITFYPWYDPCIPTYSNKVTLELRPDGDMVAYFLWFDPDTWEFYPLYSSMIMGAGMQSLFFFPEVDLAEPNYSTTKAFMFDTGAQVTVISSILTARLELNPAKPDFNVDIMDVTGEITIVPGFYLDSIQIPAIGQWLSFTNVPVIMLDIHSPELEGGYLDGIIGMNLFAEYNFVFNGGGMATPPYIEFEPIPYHIPADIAPPGGDDKVDYLDLADFTEAYLAIPTSLNWNSKADMVGDAKINLYDFAVLAEHWGQELAP